MKKLLRVLLILLLVLIVAFGGLVGYLSLTEYKPEAVEPVAVEPVSSEIAPVSAEGLRVLSWNIGYAGLGKESDFFMDGGKSARAADKPTVERYLDGIRETLTSEYPAELVLLQEVDSDSSRTYGIDERSELAYASSAFALNYSCPFVPVPFPPMGKVNSGLLTVTEKTVGRAERISLPCPFSWPVSTVNLKRCLLVSYLPVEGSDKELVLVNLHLEAYDEGEGKIAQTKQLRDFITAEYEKGNYVIAGGDFNQTFPGGLEAFPLIDSSLWTPGTLDESMLPEGWRFAYDVAVPSCRLLNQPYDPTDLAHTQYYVIDGFILSPNVELLSVETLDLGFEYSDHNPVLLQVDLKD